MVSAYLKLKAVETELLWPYPPTDSPLDTHNRFDLRTNSLLVIMTLAAIILDFDVDIGYGKC